MEYYSIAFLQTQPWEEEYVKQKLESLGAVKKVDFYTEKIDELSVDTLAEYDVISPFIHSDFTPELLEQLPALKHIATRSTGFDHIDLDAATAHKVVVSNVPSYGQNTVAEHAFALLLSLTRKIPQSVNRTKQNNFDREGLQGIDLHGKTMGVVGTGKIGRHSVMIAKGFGMNVVAYDPYPAEDLVTNYGIEYKDLSAVLAESDFVTLHVPYMPETHHMINAETIKHMKPGSFLINTARGALVENDALIGALTSGQLAGAGLDVLEGEEAVADELQLFDKDVDKHVLEQVLENHALLKLDTVLVTSHNAFNSKEALMRILDTTIENIIAFMNQKPINEVTKK